MKNDKNPPPTFMQRTEKSKNTLKKKESHKGKACSSMKNCVSFLADANGSPLVSYCRHTRDVHATYWHNKNNVALIKTKN